MSENVKPMTMRPNNKGLTVKINLWSLDTYQDDFSSRMARLWMRGQVTNAEPPFEVKKFNDAGELISILGKWNAKRFQELKAIKKKTNSN